MVMTKQEISKGSIMLNQNGGDAQHNPPANPFALDQVKNGVVKTCIKKITKLDVLEQWYAGWIDKSRRLPDNLSEYERTDLFLDHVLGELNVTADIHGQGHLDDMPQNGAFVIVANHPLGGIEGMVLTQILRKYRPDLKVLTNEMLSAIPEFKDVFIGVDVLGNNRAQYNARGMRDVARHLSKGGALLVFPAGAVSHMYLPSMRVSDLPWSDSIVRLVKKYKAPVLPIYVAEKNTSLFYLSAYIHKRLRTMLLPRAMVAKQGIALPVYVGATIANNDITRLQNDEIATSFMRLCCKVLAPVSSKKKSQALIQMDEIEQDCQIDEITHHLDKIKDCEIFKQAEFSLYCVPYQRMGPIMTQLSVERERTFRDVDEGTGKELDSDRFDPHYMHLFIWDNDRQKIAGGYRLAKTDQIVASMGLKGLYSHSLFHYNKSFLKDMGKTIEVGRSFITKDYQKNPIALDMLWKGIGRFVAREPAYHTLFGCVSISRQYSDLATSILTDTFLSHYAVDESVSRHVKARSPLKLESGKLPWTPAQLAQLSELPIINKLISRIDAGKSIPILIRHYLSLNGRFISFTVNNGFNQSLDGLIKVDLRDAPERYLKRYMGVDGLETFQSFHQADISK